MSRWIAALAIACVLPLVAQEKPELKRRDGKASPKVTKQEAEMPDEDTSVGTHEYGFNPVQAQKEIRTGNYYFKKGAFRAAAGRFEEATKWNSGEPEAWLRLGEADEKLRDRKGARAAYTKYLELATDSKMADEIRKKLEKLK